MLLRGTVFNCVASAQCDFIIIIIIIIIIIM